MDNHGAHYLFGVIGKPIAHSLSPYIHQAWLKLATINADYVPFLVQDLDTFCEWAKSSNLKGFNVTVPYKESILPYCDVLSPEVEKIGAANTIVNKEGKWHAYNTDAYGFYKSVTEELNWHAKGKDVLIFGAGGSTKAIVYALTNEEINTIYLCNRTLSKAKELAVLYKAKCNMLCLSYQDLVHRDLSSVSLVVNTTSVGLRGESLFENDSWLLHTMKVYDLIYKPKTPLLIKSLEKGNVAVGGLGMLVHQAAAAFKYFTGCSANVASIYEKGILKNAG